MIIFPQWLSCFWLADLALASRFCGKVAHKFNACGQDASTAARVWAFVTACKIASERVLADLDAALTARADQNRSRINAAR
ncbi:hypothetical protein [uncultured Campylobacter sp.]|uniref:hypothetical protein n=1 Tax=uncultured Campylobacter sp. TaxID=218934 RepID=UPI00261ECB4F|nr:hypothetical protein [uncultured Campylobacter sp.]